ncbi:MAG: PIG-L family deacetylase [Acidobacteriaceae bacterium]
MRRLFMLFAGSIAGVALFLSGPLVQPLCAQTPMQSTLEATPDYQPLAVDRGSTALWQSLKKLHTRASLMLITAHPDDEDGGMLTYESRGLGSRVALLTLNRGEGGQNVMSNDYWDQLGLVRTQELLAADRYYGVDQYWTRVADFGFSKTREESLKIWGHDRVLYDVVRAVRMNRPLVVSAVFVGGISDGHGQHQVSGEMAQEAFKAAGDPNVFPDQIKAGLLPWSPLKVYARVPSYSISAKGMFDYATGKYAPVRFYDYVTKTWTDTVPATNVTIPEGKYDPLLGLSYVQFSRIGLGFQKSQNGGTGIPLPGEVNTPYHRYGSLVPTTDTENSYFDGIDTSLVGIASLAPGSHPFLKVGLTRINALVEQAMHNYSAAEPEQIAPLLAEGLQQTQSLMQQVEQSKLSASAKYNVLHELSIKQVQFNNAILESLGITLHAMVVSDHRGGGPRIFFRSSESPFTTAIPGQTFTVAAYVNNPSSISVQIDNISLRTPAGEKWAIHTEAALSGNLADNKQMESRFRVTVAENAAYTQAYFHRDSVEQSYYNIDDKRYLNQPLSPYPVQAWASFTYNGVRIQLGQDVQTVTRANGPGDVYEPLVVAPAISVGIEPSAGIVPLEGASLSLTARIHSNVKGPAQGTIHLELPEGWTSTPASADFSMGKDGEDENIRFTITPHHLAEKPYTIHAIAEYAGTKYTTGYVTVGYPGLRPYNYYRPSTYKSIGVDVKVASGLNVGYIMGTGDDVPQSLEDLGVHVHLLNAQDIASGDLTKFDVIVLGIRTYAARPELATYNQRMLDYVKNGGVVIVQYNTGEYDHNFGPYPYSLGRSPEKVVDETAKVQLLAPQNPLLSWPNKITEKDFNGWVEERGHSFMDTWDPHYQAITETHDPDQDPQKGGLLYARYGRGAYVYVAYALYRQLPEGVPGAYRLFANLLSLPKDPALAASSK